MSVWLVGGWSFRWDGSANHYIRILMKFDRLLVNKVWQIGKGYDS